MKSLLAFLILLPTLMQAQRWHLNITGGLSNYSGDLQGKQYTFDESNFAFGGGAQYDLTTHFAITSNISYMKLSASDQYNNANLVFRNLSFQSSLVEWNLLAEYTILDMTKNRVSPFFFAGVALFHFDPYAFDTLGNKVYLRPLSTEGEGLPQYPGQKPYNLTQFSIPFGGGIKFKVDENVVLAFEIGYRKTFTDYLDDVSKVYVDKTILLAAKGPEAVELAYRANELKGGDQTYPPSGTKRGSPAVKDYYYYTGIRVSIAILSKHDGYYGRGRTDCPRNVQ